MDRRMWHECKWQTKIKRIIAGVLVLPIFIGMAIVIYGIRFMSVLSLYAGGVKWVWSWSLFQTTWKASITNEETDEKS